MTTAPLVNHVFVDFENVHEIDPAVLGVTPSTFTLLIGPEHKKLDLEVVEELLAHAASVQLIRLASKGKNAVDFALAYYLGQAVVADPTGAFHLVSQDKGYDPLVEHLKSKHVRIHRHDDFGSLAALILPRPAAQAPSPAKAPAAYRAEPPALGDATQQLFEILLGSVSRPRTRKTLTRHAITVLGNKITAEQAGRLIQELCATGKIAINPQDKVEYRFPVPPNA